MCIVIVRPPNQHLNRHELKEAFRINDDGAGFMYNYGGTVHVKKGWFGFRKFYKAFRNAESAYPNSTFVLHMRIGTSGERNRDNCHPFRVTDYVGFAHNGVMRLLGDKVRSDTREFVEDILCKLPDGWWDNEQVIAALNKCATASFSKYVLLKGNGVYKIFNESQGHWYSGCWYSNYSYVVTKKQAKPMWIDHHWDDRLNKWIPDCKGNAHDDTAMYE